MPFQRLLIAVHKSKTQIQDLWSTAPGWMLVKGSGASQRMVDAQY